MSKNNQKRKNVAIIGLGLLGTSLGKALRKSEYHRLAWTRKTEVRKRALEDDVIDELAGSIEETLSKADITVLCIPVANIPEYCAKFAENFKPGSIVSDVGSSKEKLVSQCEKALQNSSADFIGSHPMAGTEKTGYNAGLEKLYNDAVVFMTPTDKTNSAKFAELKTFWESLNTAVIEINVCEHDKLVARSSHLPHIISLALTATVLDYDEKNKILRYNACVGGFRDTSRITSSNPKMWREIIQSNQPAILKLINEFEARLANIKKLIAEKKFDELEEAFSKAKKMRDEWLKYRFD